MFAISVIQGSQFKGLHSPALNRVFRLQSIRLSSEVAGCVKVVSTSCSLKKDKVAANMGKLLKTRKILHKLLRVYHKSIGPVAVFAIATAIFLRSYYKYKYYLQYYYLYGMLGESLCWSRGAASVLCVSCCVVLLPMCRNVLTFVRNSSKVIARLFGRVCDENIWFHKTCAVIIIVATAIHIGSHLVNAVRFSTNYSSNFTDLNFASCYKQDPLILIFTSVPGLTGTAMVLILLAMIVTSTTAVRQASYEVFWYTHHLFVVFFLLLFVHGFGRVIKHQVNLDTHFPGCNSMKINGSTIGDTGNVTWCSQKPIFEADKPEAWMWCMVPLFLYAMERLIRGVRSFQKVEIIKIVDHDDGVLEVQMKKKNFKAVPGQYVYVKCQEVSKFEWHPFTLTLCPSAEDFSFSIHCKILGDWTERFAHHLLHTPAEEGQRPSEDEKHNTRYSKIKIVIDGPYGSPCTDVFSYKVSVCIATGIGVTPFAAIMNDLRLKMTSRSPVKLRRLYFVWVCKRIKSFQWFVELLYYIHVQLWEANRPDFLICNFYFTGSQQSQNEIQKKQCETWLKSRLHQNRPTWRSLFDRVSNENPRANVGVFYCGNRKVTAVLKKASERFYVTGTKFIFNKEILT
ncbi:NADPH oxidase 4-like isoform X2 [Acropora millepora]|uniref:NADPH oxidase 4-like isoform X2 n=1 Tax=Acropora millepora TaxID=45264 RepID=UPI001CF46EA0|nr:NADPH oxidase 4-like isoform X2 [Acropora millepora]